MPITTPAEQGAATNQLMHRLWYAARRAGLHLDDAELDETDDAAASSTHSRRLVTTFGLDDDSVEVIAAAGTFVGYGEGEVVQAVGSIPEAVAFITEGAVALTARTEDGRELVIGRLGVGDYLGTTALTRQRVLTGAVALRDTTLLSIPRDTMNAVVQRNPHLARMLGETIDLRRRAAEDARAEAHRPNACTSRDLTRQVLKSGRGASGAAFSGGSGSFSSRACFCTSAAWRRLSPVFSTWSGVVTTSPRNGVPSAYPR